MFSSSKALFFAAALTAAATTSTLAYQTDPNGAPVCTTAPGTACSWTYQAQDASGNNVNVNVDAICGPIRDDGNSYCADNGAACSADDQCWQNCGTNGICGGVGSQCYDQGPNVPNSMFYICGNGATCSTNCDGDYSNCGPGVCTATLAASQAAGMRKVKRVHRDFAMEARALAMKRAAKIVARAGDQPLA